MRNGHRLHVRQCSAGLGHIQGARRCQGPAEFRALPSSSIKKKNKLPHQRSLEWNILAVLLQKRKKQTKPQWPLWGVVLFWFVSSAVWAASWAALLLETNFACLRQQAVRGMGKCRGQTIPMPPRVATLHYSSEWWYWDRKSHPIVPETFLSIPALNFSISILSHLRYNLNFKLSCPK